MVINLKIHHIGYAVKDMQTTLDLFIQLGYELVLDVVDDQKRFVKIAFVKNSNYLVELISPIGLNSPISNYINKIGNTPYHFCYEVDNLEETVEKLRRMRFIVVEKASEAIALNNNRVTFMYNPNYGLLELLELTA